jgi:Carboxypeptidase regulatory-like domain
MLKSAIRVSVVLLLVGFPSLPQFEVRNVSGVVTDQRGKALPGAAVQLENLSNLSIMSYITGKDGCYYFNNLRDDVDYTLRAEYRNYCSRRKTLSKFNSSNHPWIELVVPVDICTQAFFLPESST